MPIRDSQKARYPRDWPVISRRIRARAAGRCECTGQCGLHAGRRCDEVDGEPAKHARGTVRLQVAHLNHTPEDCRDENLLALCNGCHMRHDAPEHLANGWETRHARSRDESLSEDSFSDDGFGDGGLGGGGIEEGGLGDG